MNNESRELYFYIINKNTLAPKLTAIENALARKAAKGQYKAALAPKAFKGLVDQAAKMYAHEHSASRSDWNKIFSVADRMAVARELVSRVDNPRRCSNPSPITARKSGGSIVLSIKVPSMAVAHKLAKRLAR
jgi:hypothetical protein